MNITLEEKAKSDCMLRAAMYAGRAQGWTETQTLQNLVEILLNLKDEAFQEKLEELRRSTASPFMVNIGRSNV